MPLAVSPEYIEKLKAVFSGLNDALNVLGALEDEGVRRFLEGYAVLGSEFQRAVANLIEAIALTLSAFSIWVNNPENQVLIDGAGDFAETIDEVFSAMGGALNVFNNLNETGIPDPALIQIFLEAILSVIQAFQIGLAIVKRDLMLEMSDFPGFGIGGQLPAGANITYTKRIELDVDVTGEVTQEIYDQLVADILWAVQNGG